MFPVIGMDRKNIDKIAQTDDDRLLLAKLWDKIEPAMRKNIPGSTCFLSPREQSMARYLFGETDGLHFWGGHDGAERKMLFYLPDYLDVNSFLDSESSLVCLRASFYHTETPTHRDFLGALMGSGIARESIGDICVGASSCDFFVMDTVAPYLLQNFIGAGRTKVTLTQIPVDQANIPEPEVREIRDTVASLRLDSIVSSGFQISRGAAGQYISAGRVSMDGMPCEKADKLVSVGMKISVRGLGKIKLESVGGLTKKGRTGVVIHRYV